MIAQIVDKDTQVGGLTWIEEPVAIVVVQHGCGTVFQLIIEHCNDQTVCPCLHTIDIHLQIETDRLIGHHLVVDRESEGIFHHLGFIRGKIRASSRVLRDGYISIPSCQDHGNIAHRLWTEVRHNDAHGDRLARIQATVLITCLIIDLINVVVLDSAHLDGINGGQYIHATEAIGVALAFGQRNRCLLKDAADFRRRKVDVLTQHQSHTACHARRGHRCAAHVSIARVTLIIQRLDVNTGSAHIGTDEADTRLVGIVAKLSVLPSDRTT